MKKFILDGGPTLYPPYPAFTPLVSIYVLILISEWTILNDLAVVIPVQILFDKDYLYLARVSSFENKLLRDFEAARSNQQ